MFKALIFILILCFCNYPAFAETITLNSGRTIEAEIIERTDDYIRVDFHGVPLTYYLDDIETIDGEPVSKEAPKASFYQTGRFLTSTEKEKLSERIQDQLSELHYPQHTHPAIEKELMAFFKEIDFPGLRTKAKAAKQDPDKLKELAREIGAIFEKKGFLNTTSPRLLIRLLVDSFGGDDMFAVIEQSPLSPQEKEVDKRNLYACSAISQLAGITLDLLDLPVKTVFSTSSLPTFSHAANYIQLTSGEILLLDFLNKDFEVIGLDYWYGSKGQILALKSQHWLSSERMLEINRRFQQGIIPTQRGEILNLLFLTLDLTGHYSASAIIYLNRGNAYFRKGDLSQAISDYDQALRINPNFAEAYYNRGLAYFHKGDLNQAISDYDQALRINPNFAEAYSDRGNAYFRKGDLSQAISDYDQALRINPNLVEAYYNRGNAYGDKGDLSQAISDYDQALRINPSFAEAYSNRGNAYFRKGDLSQAISDYDQALRINPNLVEAYYNRGNAYGDKGDLSQAISDYDQALRINPNLAVAYDSRALTYFHLGNYSKAWEDVRRAQKLGYQVHPEFLEELRQATGR